MRTFKTPLGIIGLLYIIFGIIMSVWMFLGQWYPSLLYFYIIGIGIFFLLINGTTKKWPQYRVWQLFIGICPVVFFYVSTQINKPSDDIFILPEGYKGIIMVKYGQENGVAKEYENGKRVYRISENGLLETQFKVKGGSIKGGEYFYVDNENKRSKISVYSSGRPFPDSSKVYVHTISFGVSSDSNGNRYHYKKSRVGTQNDPW